MADEIPIHQQVLLAYVALQNLKHDRSTTDIAEELGMSRFKVGRMISQARDYGLIDVVVKLTPSIDVELSKRLKDTYSLSEALVVFPATSSDHHSREAIAAAAARYIPSFITEGSIVGLGPGRTIIEMCDQATDFPNCDVVQLTGVATREPELSVQSIFRLSRLAGGRMYPLYAPFLATSEDAAKAIVAQPSVQEALQRMEKVDTSILTIGGWPRSSLLADMLAEAGELSPLTERGAVAEIGTTVIDQAGKVLDDISSRTIGITSDQLLRVPNRIALGGGDGKRQAVSATLRSGLVDMIITDVFSAQQALA
jgi:DNA-binding transcriptional regulator LsrR (DeoR family)